MSVRFVVQSETSLEDIYRFACTQIAKHYDAGAMLWVRADEKVLSDLDALLWSYEKESFLPHRQLFEGEQIPEVEQGIIPIILSPHAPESFAYDYALNLSEQPLLLYSDKATVIELVSTDESQKAASRLRFRQYRAQGIDIRVEE